MADPIEVRLKSVDIDTLNNRAVHPPIPLPCWRRWAEAKNAGAEAAAALRGWACCWLERDAEAADVTRVARREAMHMRVHVDVSKLNWIDRSSVRTTMCVRIHTSGGDEAGGGRVREEGAGPGCKHQQAQGGGGGGETRAAVVQAQRRCLFWGGWVSGDEGVMSIWGQASR